MACRVLDVAAAQRMVQLSVRFKGASIVSKRWNEDLGSRFTVLPKNPSSVGPPHVSRFTSPEIRQEVGWAWGPAPRTREGQRETENGVPAGLLTVSHTALDETSSAHPLRMECVLSEGMIAPGRP